MKSINMKITKDLIETTPYNDNYYKEINKRRGFFAPKIKGDPMKDSIKALRKSKGGDIASSGITFASTLFQTCNHIKTLTHLSTLSNPILDLSTILLSRFTTAVLYCNIKQTLEKTEKIPVQSNVEVGLFILKNNKTHLEGIWNIDKLSIETDSLTTTSPKYTAEVKNKYKCFSIGFNVAGILGCYVIPCSIVKKIFVSLPQAGIAKSNDSQKVELNVPMQLNAEEIFIRCNDAVFSGSQIRSKLIDMIVENKLTVESLTNLFDSKSKQSNFNIPQFFVKILKKSHL